MHHALESAASLSEVGLPVVYCLPGSAAYCSGVRRGDVIVEVNGVQITDAHAYLRACRLSSADMLLKVRRAGRTIELSISLKPDPTVQVNVSELFEC
jgi:S1-C subfamily serine protease